MKSITLETRPRLQSCNVFICMKEALDSSKIEINLSEQNIILHIDNQKYNFMSPSLKILPDSLSTLHIDGNWMSFRIQTKPFHSLFGSFKSEIIKETAFVCNDLNTAIRDNEIQLKQKECIISCAWCKQIISNKVSFRRILPLPNMDYSPNEWFCCSHNHGKDDYLSTLTPHTYEYFYAPLYKVINKVLFNSNIKIDGKIVSCGRCHVKLGSLHRSCALKIWNCYVDYRLSENSTLVSEATNPANDFLIAFQNSINNLFGEEIAFEATSGEETHYVVVKPMDFKLELLTQPKVMPNTDLITLEEVRVIKVLYKHRTHKTSVRNHEANLTYCEVPFPVLSAGLDYLVSSTERLPPTYRAADDYHIGHINLQDCKI